jgi:cell division protein FtsQ
MNNLNAFEQAVENRLKKDTWVADAELFFDNNMILHVHISEREPVARIFTTTGGSYYIDSSAHMMPLSDKMNVRIPVFTGFPSDKSKVQKADSLLMQHIKKVAYYILTNEFFRAQVAQVDITADRNFEIIPTIGNHIIDFGSGDNYEDKFIRLRLFYNQVLSKTGFDKYKRINLRFEKQVVGTKNEYTDKIDSIQALKNVQRLIEESRQLLMDTVSTSVDKNFAVVKKADSTSLSLVSAKADQEPVTKDKDSVGRRPENKSKSQSSSPHLIKKSDSSQLSIPQKPKAVMQKKE